MDELNIFFWYCCLYYYYLWKQFSDSVSICIDATQLNSASLVSFIFEGMYVRICYVLFRQNMKTISTIGWEGHIFYNNIAYIINICVTIARIQSGVVFLQHNWTVNNLPPGYLRFNFYLVAMFWSIKIWKISKIGRGGASLL